MAEDELHLVMESLKSNPEDRPLYLLAQEQHHLVQIEQAIRPDADLGRIPPAKTARGGKTLRRRERQSGRNLAGHQRTLQNNATYHGEVQYSLDRLANRPVQQLPPLEVKQEDS